jgi:hypothetical protein
MEGNNSIGVITGTSSRAENGRDKSLMPTKRCNTRQGCKSTSV